MHEQKEKEIMEFIAKHTIKSKQIETGVTVYIITDMSEFGCVAVQRMSKRDRG